MDIIAILHVFSVLFIVFTIPTGKLQIWISMFPARKINISKTITRLKNMFIEIACSPAIL